MAPFEAETTSARTESVPKSTPKTKEPVWVCPIMTVIRAWAPDLSKRYFGLELDDVRVGLGTLVGPRLQDVAPRDERLLPRPRPTKHHLVAVEVPRVLEIDALGRQEMRRDDD